MNDTTELQKPDWEYWRARGAAKLPEAVLLSLDIEPKQALGHFNGREARAYDKSEYRSKGSYFCKASSIGSALDDFSNGLGQAFVDRLLMAENLMPGESQTTPAEDFLGGHVTITTYCTASLSEFADWAASKRLSMPPELAGMASGPIPESRLSMVMKEDHPDHSKELAGAIRAWLAVIIDDDGNKQAVPKARIAAHLKKQGFGNEAVGRIAIVCNPERRKNGGRS